MRTFLFVILCVEIVLPIASQSSDWQAFKLKYGKVYRDEEDDKHHMESFLENVKKIEEHNRQYDEGKFKFTLGLNKYSDLTYDELADTMLMDRDDDDDDERNFTKYPFELPKNFQAPESIDWRDSGYVTRVKDQGSCGSCYAFSAVGGLEGQNFKKTGELISLSEQNILDCSLLYGNNGCNGGYLEASFDYVSKNDGIENELTYPYDGYVRNENASESVSGKSEVHLCDYSSSDKVASCSGYRSSPSGDEIALRDIVANVGPIPACIYAAESFHQYSGGIYYGYDCPNQGTNHCILIVGYGSDNGDDYWIVKNSWGRSYGEDGYIKMARNRNDNCQIADSAHFPVV